MPDIADIISRMCVLEPKKNSSDSTSWHAHREAENLSDSTTLDELLTFQRNVAKMSVKRLTLF